MNKRQLLTLLDQLGVRPSRRLGQNFLLDPNLCDAIVAQFNPQPGEEVLEIGPGTGVLTERLLMAGCRVTAVEIDYRLAQWLEQRFARASGFRLLREDACKLDYDRVMTGPGYRCLANLPYAVSSPWLIHMLQFKHRPLAMDLLVQKELADRLTANPRTRQYGSLTVAVRCCYRIKLTRQVPPTVFFPVPEVDSACLNLSLEPLFDLADEHLRQTLMKLVRLSFSRRRRQLLSVLSPHYTEMMPQIRRALATRGISRLARAEELAPETFLALARQVDKLREG